MNMLDRVADAIRCATDDDNMLPWDKMTDRAKKPWREKAKDVLEAMYEPDASMITAGFEAYEDADPTDTRQEALTQAWGAMIHDAAEGSR